MVQKRKGVFFFIKNEEIEVKYVKQYKTYIAYFKDVLNETLQKEKKTIMDLESIDNITKVQDDADIDYMNSVLLSLDTLIYPILFKKEMENLRSLLEELIKFLKQHPQYIDDCKKIFNLYIPELCTILNQNQDNDTKNDKIKNLFVLTHQYISNIYNNIQKDSKTNHDISINVLTKELEEAINKQQEVK